MDLMRRLLDVFPGQFVGIKDSTGDPEHARTLGRRFGHDLRVFNGNDRLFSLALDSGAAGCITALANLCSPWLRQVWEAHIQGAPCGSFQARLDTARQVFENYTPAPPTLKVALNRIHQLPAWTVRPPLLPLPPILENQAVQELAQVL
jgi:dihydrodipicolinate synthase/N-acetylneuraminate lyase